MKAIGIDIGTTSVCGILLDTDTGKLLKSVTRNSNAFLKGCAPWEKIQSVSKIISIAKEILEEFISEDIVSIGITGQMHGIVYLDKNLSPVSPLYTWQDRRGSLPYKDTTYASFLKSFPGYGCVTDFYNRENGIRPKDAKYFCTIQDYFVLKLCSLEKPVIHPTNAASLGCFDIKKNKFSYEYEGEITDGYKIAGEYKNIPVSVATGDNQASVFSTLADENNILLNVGTGSQISVISDIPLCGNDIETRPYFDNKYLICGASLCGGRSYSLLKNFYLKIICYEKEVTEDKVYEVMAKMLEESNIPPLKVDTRFAGTRSNPDTKGSILEITEENFTPSSLTLGVLRGIASDLFQMYKQMNVSKKGIIGSGNGIRKNPSLIRIFEDMFGSKMKIPSHFEEASFGAALYSLISCGYFRNSKEAQKLISYKNGRSL